jgi:hypothetical protein
MKSTNELTDYYYTELNENLTELEEERKAIIKRIAKANNTIRIVAFAILFIAIITGIGMNIIAVIVIAFGAAYIAKNIITKDYKRTFKRKIIKQLIGALDKNLHYNASGSVSQTHFKNSGLFSRSNIGLYRGNDHVRGTVDGVAIEFSDLDVLDKRGNPFNKTSLDTIFHGLFIVSEFNKNFHGTTIVLPDRTEKHFGSIIAQWMQSNKLEHTQRIKLDDPEFEKHFVVYSDDQIEARYLLTSTMMQRLLSIKKRAKADLSVSFRGDRLYLAISFNRDLFEPDINQSLLSYKQANEYIKMLRLAIGTVEELKLNKKLWNKQ